MGNVTNVMLSFSKDELESKNDPGTYPIMNQLSSWMESKGLGRFIEIGNKAGGAKGFTTPVYAIAFEQFDWKDLLDLIGILPWKNREHLQVFVQLPENDFFIIFQIRFEEKP